MENTTLTKQQSIEYFNELIAEAGHQPLSESEAGDWVYGGETYAAVESVAREFVSVMHTERCANKDSWRYTN